MNKMIENPDKFQANGLNKKRFDLTNTNFQVYNQVIKSLSSVELLGIQIDDKLNFNLHISKICKSAANQLNALIRLKQFLSFHAKEVLINSYIISNFKCLHLFQLIVHLNLDLNFCSSFALSSVDIVITIT